MERIQKIARGIELVLLLVLALLGLVYLPFAGISVDFLTEILAIVLNSTVLIAVIIFAALRTFRDQIAEAVERLRELKLGKLGFLFSEAIARHETLSSERSDKEDSQARSVYRLSARLHTAAAYATVALGIRKSGYGLALTRGFTNMARRAAEDAESLGFNSEADELRALADGAEDNLDADLAVGKRQEEKLWSIIDSIDRYIGEWQIQTPKD